MQIQVSALKAEVDKVSKILKGPEYLTEALKSRFDLRAEWKGTDSVRYVLYEKITAGSEFTTRRSAGLASPWVTIPVSQWEKNLADFEIFWKSNHEQLVFSFEKDFNDWLISHGFPGITKLRSGYYDLN